MDQVIPSLLASLSGDEAGQVNSCAMLGRQVISEGTSEGVALLLARTGAEVTGHLTCSIPQALAGLRVILSVRPSALATMLPRLLKPPLSAADIIALGSLAEVAGAPL